MDQQVGKLAARGEECGDLLTYLWKGYSQALDYKFQADIEDLNNRHNDGRDTYSTPRLMVLAENKYEQSREGYLGSPVSQAGN